MNEFFFQTSTTIGAVEIRGDTTLEAFSGSTAHSTVRATEMQCMTGTNVSGNGEDGGKPQQTLRKTDEEHGCFQKPHARRAGTEVTTIGGLTSVTTL